jgi:hypothetical protein
MRSLAVPAPDGISRPLQADDFVRVAERGFGDTENGRAHAMAWFAGHLYVGVTRHPQRRVADARSRPPAATGTADAGEYTGESAPLWCYDPHADGWAQVLVSADAAGYRRMLPVPGDDGEEPALYVTTISLAGGSFLRTEDGRTFAPMTAPRPPGPASWSFRPLASAHGRLYTAPVGTVDGSIVARNRAASATIYRTELNAGAAPAWTPVSDPGFGDPTNVAIFEVERFDGGLYAGTLNPSKGFQVWKLALSGSQRRWQRVVSDGAFRGNANESVASMTAFKGALFVGTGIQGLGFGRGGRRGPTAAELIRIWPDDSWELVVGESRRTFEGPRPSLSGLGPGFGDPCNSVIWQLREHDGWLYAGTHDWSAFLPARADAPRRHAPGVRGRDQGPGLGAREPGFDLWRSADGTTWEPVTCAGFGNPLNYGVRTLASTPEGLFVGTATVPRRSATAGDGDTEAGGCEIWLGSRSPRTRRP